LDCIITSPVSSTSLSGHTVPGSFSRLPHNHLVDSLPHQVFELWQLIMRVFACLRVVKELWDGVSTAKGVIFCMSN